MIVYQPPNPVIFHIYGPLAVHWYGICYVLGFIVIFFYGRRLIRKKTNAPKLDQEDYNNFLFFSILGVLIGGRLGYMVFYDFHEFIINPITFFKVYQGGMSFHGGLLGVLFSIIAFGKLKKKRLGQLLDFASQLAPIGLGLGRIGNLINGELWGRPTGMPWGIIYRNVDKIPRHPSQIYEFLLEGVILFFLLKWLARKEHPEYFLSGSFAIFYGIFRIIAENFREPDHNIGFIIGHWLTMGQILSLPVLILGLILVGLSRVQY